jgi:hypothetical protein
MTNPPRMILAVCAEGDDALIWDRVQTCQAELFEMGPLQIKLAYFGAELTPPCRPFIATRWCSDADDMADLIRARAGCVCGCFVAISDILEHALRETRAAPVQAVVIIGDGFHGELDDAIATAMALRSAGTKLFMFEQGRSPGSDAFRTLAEATAGAYVPFNPHIELVAERLPGLFEAVTDYAIGGIAALEARDDEPAALLLDQMTTKPLTGG